MSVAPHELSYQAAAEHADATQATPARGPALLLRVVRCVPRVMLNLALVGVLGLVMMLMWAPGYIGANEHTHREWRRPPGERGFWFNRGPRDGRWGTPRPDRPNPR